ncbi:hypothetical protein MAC_08582 [Metarhizium acridum CQMa 102]|uniref:Ankyrin 2,3/unc44 n=1 Tax=Metarhizium acridum (strain CQMa 102) TaxID=655827 RepID=E9EFD4_METAQ|nr:uncharacterized protein MAC_08582 [Metarhizium acridum CQMa 102]EFY85387.1 hypothetical protein MAC_08582 [Metarhizium acridum CQMa 102]
MSDEQLCEYMKKHRQRDGSIELPVDDWTVLSKEERDRLAERLRLIQREIADNPAANSRPLDLDKLDALLRDVASGQDSPSHDRPRSSERVTEPPSESPQEMYKRKEMEAYNNLVNDGGHPLYQINLLESVSKDPNVYFVILKPFWRPPRSDKPSEADYLRPEDVLQRQWHRWQNFRKWQLNNRGINYKDDYDDEAFSAYVEDLKREYREIGWDEQAARIEADPNSLKQPGEWWHAMQTHCNWRRRYQRELECHSFSDYQGAVRARLARHGFTRSFYLAEDPKQQDKLTTWIEYLGFEYWWLDRYTALKERLKLKHDNAWIELKKQGVVKDNETPDFIRRGASALQRQVDEDRAKKAAKDAELEAANVYHQTQQDPNRLNISMKRRVQMLAKARTRLSNARETVDSIVRRNDLLLEFVRGTFDYDNANQDVVNQVNLLEWAVEETPSIKDEQKAGTLGGEAMRKRKVSTEDGCIVETSSKKQKSHASKQSLHGAGCAFDRSRGGICNLREQAIKEEKSRIQRWLFNAAKAQETRVKCPRSRLANQQQSSTSTESPSNWRKSATRSASNSKRPGRKFQQPVTWAQGAISGINPRITSQRSTQGLTSRTRLQQPVTWAQDADSGINPRFTSQRSTQGLKSRTRLS